WGLISTAEAKSPTHNSSARGSACSIRKRLSLASSLNSAITSVAWSVVSNGLSLICRLPVTVTIGSEQLLLGFFIETITQARVIDYQRQFVTARLKSVSWLDS